jgi:hypothetical protein
MTRSSGLWVPANQIMLGGLITKARGPGYLSTYSNMVNLSIKITRKINLEY